MRRKRHGSEEINLNSLLDVLFIILFVVMLKGMQNEETVKTQMQQEVSQLQNQIESYELYEKEALVITIQVVKEDENRYISVGEEMIQLNENASTYMRTRLQNIIAGLLEDVDNTPVYIVFHCNKKEIYTKEFNMIDDVMSTYQDTVKEVFYKVIYEEE